MRLANVSDANGLPRAAAVHTDGRYIDLAGALAASTALDGRDAGPLPGSVLDLARDARFRDRAPAALEALERSGRIEEFLLPSDSRLLAPLPSPVRILAIGRNYAEHAREQGNEVFGEPIVFLKASTSVVGPDESIVIPGWVGRVDYEAELMVVLGSGGKDIAEDDAMALVAGYTVFNDVTARERQKADIAEKHPWFRSKSMDTFGPMGPFLVTADEVADPHSLDISLTVNGVVKQQDNTSSMIYRIPTLIAFLSRWFRLYPGDVIATGTPSGIGPLVPGDTVTATVKGVGTLTNPVIAG
jgi:5-oxopent-3-ene-1,2,5-tricarboxylate decarboxylase/2-hydroxyhepta-2,4-diene-1,7-dioate isomerase